MNWAGKSPTAERSWLPDLAKLLEEAGDKTPKGRWPNQTQRGLEVRFARNYEMNAELEVRTQQRKTERNLQISIRSTYPSFLTPWLRRS